MFGIEVYAGSVITTMAKCMVSTYHFGSTRLGSCQAAQPFQVLIAHHFTLKLVIPGPLPYSRYGVGKEPELVVVAGT
jgi:hypothetical protein